MSGGIQLTLKNYRCFSSPATVSIEPGYTAFVGVNNAGKSAFMRFFLEFRNFFGQIRDQKLRSIWNGLNGGRSGINLIHVDDPQEVFSNLNQNPIELCFDIPSGASRPNSLRLAFQFIRELTWTCTVYINGAPVSQTEMESREPSELILKKQIYDLGDFLNLAGSFASTLYVGPFRNAINVGSKDDYLDIQIGEAFIRRFRQLKSGTTKLDTQRIQDLTETIKDIFGFRTLEINATSDDKSLQLIVNGKTFRQHELGSGLVQFVIVLANAAIRRPSFILIDEPELNLHPSLQLSFLNALGAFASDRTWFSTHSLGLARAAGQVVYSVTRIGDGNSVIRPLAGTPRIAELLGEMSFSSHKEVGFEKVLLVEGPTDLTAFQYFLSRISKTHKILMLPLHGHMPQADELEETFRITTNVAAIIDSERTSQNDELGADRNRFVQLCQSRNVPILVLERRAIENYFPDSVVKSVFGLQHRALAPFEKLTDVQPHWSKGLNWKLAAATPWPEIQATDLGKFLEAL
jgi:hypothetical protein